MIQLYPIIRRIRRPLVAVPEPPPAVAASPAPPPVVVTDQGAAAAPTEAETLPLLAAPALAGRSSENKPSKGKAHGLHC